HAAIALAADEPPGALLQRVRGLGDEILGERIAAVRLEPLDARLDERIVRRRERQLVDHDALQRLARNVDAFPEALRADKDGVRRVEEALHELALRALALDQHLDRPAGGVARAAHLA